MLMHVFYLVNFWIAFIFGHWGTYTTHLWSLSVEEQFYVLFPIIALMTPSKRLHLLCIVVVCSGLLIGGVSTLYYQNTFAAQLTCFGITKIALGGFVVLVFASRTPQHGKASILPAILLVIYVLSALLLRSHPKAASVFGVLIGPVIIAVTLWSVHRNQSSYFVRLLEWLPLRKLGIISYGFYVYHYPLNAQLIGSLLHYDIGGHWPSYAIKLFDFSAPLLAAMLSWRYIEQPILARRPVVVGGPRDLPQQKAPLHSFPCAQATWHWQRVLQSNVLSHN